MSITKFLASDVFNANFFGIITPIYEGISIISIAFSSILIYIIATKTPKQMKSFKAYLLPYTIHHLMVEICMFLMCPALLHPFVFVYPLGAAKSLPPNCFLLLLGLSGYFASSIFDCIIAMNLERYYAMKSFDNDSSKIPSYVYWSLQGLSFLVLCFIAAVAFYKPFYAEFIVSPESVNSFIESRIFGLDKIIDTSKVIVFLPTEKLVIPFIPLLWIVVGTIRVNVALITFAINARLSHSLPAMQNHNRLLLRLVYIQFFGIAGILFSSVLICIAVYAFFREPNTAVSCCIGIMSCFCLYDTAVTVLFIKPYRRSFVVLFKKLLCFKKADIVPMWTTNNL